MREVLINAGAGEIRVAVVADGRLEELSFERTIGAEDGARAPSGDGGPTPRAPPTPGPEGAGGSARPQ